MLRYYMTPETRQAVIAESNRLIAHRAARGARGHPDTIPAVDPLDDDAPRSQASDDGEPSSVESVFARLVADLQGARALARDELERS